RQAISQGPAGRAPRARGCARRQAGRRQTPFGQGGPGQNRRQADARQAEMSVRLAVFDCDGTLCDGQAAVCAAMEWAFAETGLPAPDRQLVRRTVGLSLPQAVALLAPELLPVKQGDIVEAYKQAFRRAREEGSLREPLFDGI